MDTQRMVTRRTRTRNQHWRRPQEAWRICTNSGQPRNFESTLGLDWRPIHRLNFISTLAVVTFLALLHEGVVKLATNIRLPKSSVVATSTWIVQTHLPYKTKQHPTIRNSRTAWVLHHDAPADLSVP